MEQGQKTSTVRQLSLMVNAPGEDVAEIAGYYYYHYYYDYYPLLAVGDAKEHPGAELNAA